MKKIFSVVLSLMFIAVFSTAYAGGHGHGNDGGNSIQTSSQIFNVGSQPLDIGSTSFNGDETTSNSGYTYHSGEVWAQGEKSAFSTYDGYSVVTPTSGYFQKDINGGELSGSFSKTTGYTTVDGFAIGADNVRFGRCSNNYGPDYAGMEFEIGGELYQSNKAYSDDRQSWAGGSNSSMVSFTAYDTDYSNGNGWGGAAPAIAEDGMSAGGETKGGTLTWAKQTDTKSTVGSITGNTGSAWSCGAPDFNMSTAGVGDVRGYATLPSVGYSSYNATFSYTGGNNAYGLAGGTSTVEKVGSYGTKSSSSSFATVGNTNGNTEK